MQPTPPTHRNRCVVSMTEALHWCRKPLEQIVPVVIALEGAIRAHPDVVCLLLRELRKVGTQSREMQLRDLFVQLLWQEVDVVLVGLCLLPVLQKVKLRKHLVREGARHHERRVSGSAAQVQEPATC